MKVKSNKFYFIMIIMTFLISVLMLGWTTSVSAFAETVAETSVSADPVYTYYIKLDDAQRFVWLGEDASTSSRTGIEYGTSFNTMTELEVAYKNDEIRTIKEGHIFEYFVFADGELQGERVLLYEQVYNYGVNTPVKIYAAYTKEIGFEIYWTEALTNKHGSLKKSYGEDITELKNISTHEDYIITGWRVSDDSNNSVFDGTEFAIGNEFTRNTMPDLSVDDEKNGGLLVIEAITEQVYSNVTLKTVFGTVLPDSVRLRYGEPFTLPTPTEVAGREFLGWCLSSENRGAIAILGTQITDENGQSISAWQYAEDVILDAAWHTLAYTISYDLNGGSYPEGVTNPSWYMVDDTVTLNNPVKAHNIFAGWKDGATNIVSNPTTIDQGTIGNKSYTAEWEPIKYTLTFSADNLSTGYMTVNGLYETVEAEYGEEIKLPDVGFAGFILKSGSTYYQQGSQFTVFEDKDFELVPKNRTQLYDSSTGYYEIWTYDHLNNIVRSYSSQKYRLMANITQPENTNWVPIPTFTGTFDGNNYWINDLTIKYGLTGANTTITRVNYGLFEENKGIIKNLGVSQGAFSFYKYTASYSSTPIYCGFIAAKNSGTISYCEVLGSFFQFAYIAPYIESISGSICGYNTGRVEYCEVFETGIQLTTGFGGGIVGHNKGGVITHCEIALSGVSCYQEFESDTEDGYSSGHYGAVGGIVGYAEGGTISYCDVASNVDVDYNGFSSSSRSLAPELGIIAGRSTSTTTYTSNVAEGSTGAINGLNVITWETGWWIFAEKHTWNQAQYVGGTVGRYV